MKTVSTVELPLNPKRLRKPAPDFATGNRVDPVKVLNEDELNAKTHEWFAEIEGRIGVYNQMGTDLSWMVDWGKKWWLSWFNQDMDLCREICTPDITWEDPVSFGSTLHGIDEFIAYNDAFFDAIPDWRYDPIDPGWIDYSPEYGARMMVRYVGSGHWDAPLKLYPFDKGAAAIPGTGEFVQCRAQDHYLFNDEGKLCGGWTLWDAFEPLQISGLLPKVDSRAFKVLTGAASAHATLKKRGFGLF